MCIRDRLNDHQCRPPKTLHFAANHDTGQVAISITKDGFVRIGEQQPDWVSLSGIVWTRSQYMMEEESLLETSESETAMKAPAAHNLQWSGAIKPLPGWRQKQALIAHKHGNLCILAGQLSGNTWLRPNGGPRMVGQLPSRCRPFARTIFSSQSLPAGRPLRIDLHPNGKVEVIGVEGRPLQPLGILDGIVFSTVEGTKLKMNTGFEAWGKGYQAPQARAENGICHIQGLVKGDLKPRKIATLPEWCWPQRTLTFNSPYNDHVLRLDVNANGELWLKSTNKGQRKFVSLSAITFPIPYQSAYGAIMNTPCK
eukprot:TRINITY_DN1598_c0_g1_i3.p1 TRINITY_DN1598_c0_g1~~TRINITY_DN1598_c0_g1_i3.p1  ORF type:complete len:311 (+),score=37.55 TRINITY_DN1598_c0_g1_i3:132-1064(+)